MHITIVVACYTIYILSDERKNTTSPTSASRHRQSAIKKWHEVRIKEALPCHWSLYHWDILKCLKDFNSQAPVKPFASMFYGRDTVPVSGFNSIYPWLSYQHRATLLNQELKKGNFLVFCVFFTPSSYWALISQVRLA